MMAVDINGSAKIESGVPRVLFDTGINFNSNVDQYAVTADGQRFLIPKRVTEAEPAPITVVINWTTTLTKK